MSKILFLPRENKIHIFKPPCNVLFIIYHADDGVLDDFPKISDHLPKICEDFPKLFRRLDERSRTFPKISENFRRCPKIAEDCRRLSRKTEDVSMIHQRI